MRTLSLNMRRALFAPQSGDFPIFLLTVTHPDFASTIRLSTDATTRLSTTPLIYGTTSRAMQFLFVGCDVTLPDERDKGAPSSKLVLSNVDRSIMPLIRSVQSPASCLIECVLKSDLDTVELTVPLLDVGAAEWNGSTITFDMTVDALATEPFGYGSFDPASFPGLF